jgi:hypothetical protein
MSRRFLICLAMAAVVAAACVARAEESKSDNLPLTRVVLFSSGVGFFEHAGHVKDNAKIEMKFSADQINDLLKSMVVQDFDGGQVSTITYGSKDPITKTLKSFSIDLTTNPTLAQLLGQIRGERIVLEAPDQIAGVILGVETHKKRLSDHETIDVDVLNLLTDAGLRAVPLDAVGRLKLANEQLDAELRKALAVLAAAHSSDKKSVELSFVGHGDRRVEVGYIQATPIWKTTYRLVLQDGKKPFLQGWAIVENTSEVDWSGVNLSLVSGRPISFTMDLYQPLYVARPEEQLELYASLRPQVYGQDLADKDAQLATVRRMREQAATKGRADEELYEDGRAGGMGGMPGAAPRSPAHSPMDRFDLARCVRSAAEAGNVGNLFRYAIAMPVTLPRQQSAMLPIVNAEVEGQKVSIYNAAVDAKHPLYGLRFKNLTDLYLMQGPITVFDGGVYGGDAKIEDIPPGSERLISYGLDLDTEVAPESKSRPEELLGVRLLKGVMTVTNKSARSVEYTIKNSNKKAKTVLVEYPIEPDWTLISPKEPAEKTRDRYRFAVEAKPGEPAKLLVSDERINHQQVAITNLDDKRITLLASNAVVSEPVKRALAETIRRKQQIEQLVVQRQQREQRIRDIGEDQSRIRQNMAQLDRQIDIYRRYVKKLSDQESQIEQLRAEIVQLSAEETNQRKSLDDYLLGLDL